MTEGHDNESLLYNFLDELLFLFSTEFFIPCKVSITEFCNGPEDFKITCKVKGEEFDLSKHTQGTEVKVWLGMFNFRQLHIRTCNFLYISIRLKCMSLWISEKRKIVPA